MRDGILPCVDHGLYHPLLLEILNPLKDQLSSQHVLDPNNDGSELVSHLPSHQNPAHYTTKPPGPLTSRHKCVCIMLVFSLLPHGSHFGFHFLTGWPLRTHLFGMASVRLILGRSSRRSCQAASREKKEAHRLMRRMFALLCVHFHCTLHDEILVNKEMRGYLALVEMIKKNKRVRGCLISIPGPGTPSRDIKVKFLPPFLPNVDCLHIA